MKCAAFCFAHLTLVVSFASAQTVDWTQWRGPDRNGVVDSIDWQNNLDEDHLKQSWRVDLGPSYSGPIVVGDKVFTTETREKREEIVTAFDRTSGEKLWESNWDGAMRVPFFAKRNGDWIRSTPVYDEGKLFVAGMKDMLVCLDAENGEIIWSLDFPAKFATKKPEFGFVSSPLIDGDFVFVQAGGAFFKLKKANGEVVWKTADDGGGMYGSAFSSPIVAELVGVRQLVIQSRTELMGISLDDGSIVWRKEIPAFRGMNILTPTVFGNQIFTSSYQGKARLIEVKNDNGTWQVIEKWQAKPEAYMSSPVVVDGKLYMHLRNQRFTCVDLLTGKEHWRSKPFGEYASLIAGKDNILALDQRGELLLFEANPDEFKLISRRKVSDQETWAHLAVRGQQVFVRELNALSVYQWLPRSSDNDESDNDESNNDESNNDESNNDESDNDE